MGGQPSSHPSVATGRQLRKFDERGINPFPNAPQTLNGQKVIVVDRAYPISAQTPVGAVTEYDTAHLKWRMNEQEVYNPASVSLVAPQTLSSPDFALFPVGDDVAVRFYVYSVVGFQFSFNENADLTFDHLAAENCPGIVYFGYGCDRGFGWNACVIQRRDPNHDLVSSGADGVHITSTHGDTVLRNCDFSYMGDDGLNLCSVWMTVASRLNRQQAAIVTTVADPNYVEIGDELEFLTPSTLAPIGTAHVSAIGFDSVHSLYTLTFREALPASLPSGTVVANLARSSNRASITNNYFHDHRARGMLVQVHDVSITNNHIRNVMGGAIQLTSDFANWREGYGCEDIVVTGNLCDGCNDGLWGGFNNLPGICLGVINVFCQVPAGLDSHQVHEYITLSGNTIKHTPNLSFFIGSAGHVIVSNNTLENLPSLRHHRHLCLAGRGCRHHREPGDRLLAHARPWNLRGSPDHFNDYHHGQYWILSWPPGDKDREPDQRNEIYEGER